MDSDFLSSNFGFRIIAIATRSPWALTQSISLSLPGPVPIRSTRCDLAAGGLVAKKLAKKLPARAQLTGDERAARAGWRTTSSHLHVPATAIHGRARVERVRSCVGRPGIFFNVDNWLTCVLDMQHTYVGCWLRINVVHADHFVVAGEMHNKLASSVSPFPNKSFFPINLRKRRRTCIQCVFHR